MSSIYSAVLAVSVSASNGPECEPSRSARSIVIANACCESTGQLSLFTEMSESLPQRVLWQTPVSDDAVERTLGKFNSRGEPKLSAQVLISSAAVSRAKIFPLQEKAQDWRASAAAYGRSTPELLARFNPDTSSWKTSQLCLDGDYQSFSESWPRSGTMRNGTAYRLRPLVRLTDATASGLWRTLDASVVTGGAANAENRKQQNHAIGLHDQVNTPSMWPTPTNRDWRSEKCSPEFYEEREMETRGKTLVWEIGGALNPAWVEWLMGFPLGWTDLEH